MNFKIFNTGNKHSHPPQTDDFAEDLRVYRNKVSGPVLKERFDGFPLGDFYSKHHAFVVWLV
jgi:hypothetical protein